MLDTNIVSQAIRDPHGSVQRRIVESSGEIAVSVVVAAELRYGAERKQSARLATRVEELFGMVSVVPLPVGADHHYARIRAALDRVGKSIGPNDLLIVAHAIALGAALVTDNVREFSRVDGLAVENWLRA